MLITADKDFGELIFKENNLTVEGVMLLRLNGVSAEKKSEIVSNVFKYRAADLSRGGSVISPGQVRITDLGNK